MSLLEDVMMVRRRLELVDEKLKQQTELGVNQNPAYVLRLLSARRRYLEDLQNLTD